MMEQNENKNSEKQSLQNINIKSFFPFFYISYDQIVALFKQNKSFMSSYKNNYIELEKEYSKYYNLDTRKKLNTIIPQLEASLSTFLLKIEHNSKASVNDELNNLTYVMSYSKILNKIIRLNKILLFKYTIDNDSTYNFNQLISLIMFMDYPKEIILNINNISLISAVQFKILVTEIIKKENVVSLTVYFNKNYFTFARNSKKMFIAIKESNLSTNKTFLNYRNIAFDLFNNAIKIENLGYNFENFFEDSKDLDIDKMNLSYVSNIEISFCFSDEKKQIR
jgi:hypothetical protein